MLSMYVRAHDIQNGASVVSWLKSWVEMFEVDAGVFGFELPVDKSTGGVSLMHPCVDFRAEFRFVRDAAVHALPSEHS